MGVTPLDPEEHLLHVLAAWGSCGPTWEEDTTHLPMHGFPYTNTSQAGVDLGRQPLPPKIRLRASARGDGLSLRTWMAPAPGCAMGSGLHAQP